MVSFAMSMFLDSELGAETELPHAGSSLEHPLVFDSVARELRQLAAQGRIEITHEHQSAPVDGLIDQLSFRRLH